MQASNLESPRLPLDAIRVVPGFNPRRYFDDDALAELADSIKTQGVIQAIVVRATDEGYDLVAGERRFRAARLAGLNDIPATVRTLTDSEAMAIAAAENSKRDDISVGEEARLAKRAQGLCEGDAKQAAKLLGWPESRFKRRLLLLHATDSVLDALEQRRIEIGHAELLSSIPPQTQDGTLSAIIERGLSVAELKGRIGDFTRELAHARFNTAACQGCPFNSSTQASLFDFSVGPGRCSNAECWGDKNHAHVEAVIAEQSENVATVHRESERDPSTRTRLMADGHQGVGAAQLAACRSCQFYGTLVSDEPGREGALTEGVCFELSCHAKMAAAHRRASEADDQIIDSAKTTATTSKTSAPPAQTHKKSPASVPRAVEDQSKQVIRNAAAAETQGDAAQAIHQTFAIVGLLALADRSDENVKSALAKAATDATPLMSSDKLYQALLGGSSEERVQCYRALVQHLLGTRANGEGSHDWQKIAAATVGYAKTDLRQHFTLDAGFLKAHTKSGMDVLLRDAGFDQWYDESNGEGSFTKLMKAKIDLIVAAVLPEKDGYDFTGFIPKSVSAQAPDELEKSEN